jgi:hypothetical protein
MRFTNPAFHSYLYTVEKSAPFSYEILYILLNCWEKFYQYMKFGAVSPNDSSDNLPPNLSLFFVNSNNAIFYAQTFSVSCADKQKSEKHSAFSCRELNYRSRIFVLFIPYKVIAFFLIVFHSQKKVQLIDILHIDAANSVVPCLTVYTWMALQAAWIFLGYFALKYWRNM